MTESVFKLLESQWPVIQGRRHSKAVVHQGLFSRAVTVEHSTHLTNSLVRFVDEHQVVLGHIVEEGWRRFPRQTAAEVARIVLDTVAIADGAHHFDVKHGPLHDALRLDKFSLLLQLLLPPPQLFLNADNGAVALLLRHHVVRLRINRNARQIFLSPAHLTGERIDLPQRIDLVAPHFDAVRLILISGIDFDHVAAHAEAATAQVFAAVILNIDKPA